MATGVTFYRQGDTYWYQSDGDIAGIELHFSGEAKNPPQPAAGLPLEFACGDKQTSQIALFYRLTGRGLTAGQGELLTVAEGQRITSVTVSDPLGKPIPATVRELPATYALYQNYPNPFNPATTIAFDLPESSPVTLKVYDMLGNEVNTLTDRVFQAGSYQVVWDGTNQHGLQASSGIYFYALKTAGIQKIKKMMLVR